MLTLSPPQTRVIAHRGTDLQVIACAGSGKTEAMARRVAALLSEGVPPASIVAFTFTDRAAAELKERIVRRVTEAEGPTFRDRLSPLYVGTIHAYCFQLLQEHVPRYGNYDVLDENRHAGFLAREFRAIGLDKLARRKWQPIRDFARAVDVIGNEGIRPEALGDTQLAASMLRAGDLRGACTRSGASVATPPLVEPVGVPSPLTTLPGSHINRRAGPVWRNERGRSVQCVSADPQSSSGLPGGERRSAHGGHNDAGSVGRDCGLEVHTHVQRRVAQEPSHLLDGVPWFELHEQTPTDSQSRRVVEAIGVRPSLAHASSQSPSCAPDRAAKRSSAE